MRILVIGAGAVGGYFGGRLVQAGRDVTFLVRAGQAERLRQKGLQIISPFHGDAVIKEPRLVLAGELGGEGPFDLILLSVKAYGLAAAIEDFAPAVGPRTMIVPALNGLSHLERLVERFGDEAVLGGVCLVTNDVDSEGRIVQLSEIQEWKYGERAGPTDTERMRQLDSVLQNAGFVAGHSGSILQDMWEKWIQLASLGAINCLLRGNIGEVVAAPRGAELALQMLEEANAIAAACGYPPREAFLTVARQRVTTAGSKLASSMYRDLRKGSRVEADQILGDFLERGRQQGVAAPLTEAAFIQLRVYEAGRAGA